MKLDKKTIVTYFKFIINECESAIHNKSTSKQNTLRIVTEFTKLKSKISYQHPNTTLVKKLNEIDTNIDSNPRGSNLYNKTKKIIAILFLLIGGWLYFLSEIKRQDNERLIFLEELKNRLSNILFTLDKYNI
jgi:hypothetical protein